MKQRMIIAAACLTLAGCGDGYDAVKVRGAVSDQHPGAEVQQLPDSQWRFLVKEKSGRILYVEYMGGTLEPTARATMFDAP